MKIELNRSKVQHPRFRINIERMESTAPRDYRQFPLITHHASRYWVVDPGSWINQKQEEIVKKGIVPIIVVSLLIFAPIHASALSVGAPSSPVEDGGSAFSGSISYLSVDVENINVDSKSFILKGIFGISESVAPYFKLGFADISVDADSFEGNLGFAYGGGIILELFSPGEADEGLTVSVDAQALWTNSSEAGLDYDFFEGQLAVLGSMKSSGTTGYGGFASSLLSLDGGGNNRDEGGQSHLFFGLDYFMDYNFYFNIEAHLFGEDAISAGVGYIF